MEKIILRNMLYDFYGELLTEHQRNVYEDAVFNDLSLSELSEDYGITRQGVHDLIKRCDKLLEGYEEKLHLVEKCSKVNDIAYNITQIAEAIDDDKALEIIKLSESIIELL